MEFQIKSIRYQKDSLLNHYPELKKFNFESKFGDRLRKDYNTYYGIINLNSFEELAEIQKITHSLSIIDTRTTEERPENIIFIYDDYIE